MKLISCSITTVRVCLTVHVSASLLQVCAGIRSGNYPFVMCNFAAPDMVGHTGKYEPAVKACTATGKA